MNDGIGKEGSNITGKNPNDNPKLVAPKNKSPNFVGNPLFEHAGINGGMEGNNQRAKIVVGDFKSKRVIMGHGLDDQDMETEVGFEDKKHCNNGLCWSNPPGPMSCLSLNYRGLGNPHAIQMLSDLV